ncbi:MAG: ABC transporter ATP-binding protein [Caldilinea sp. CFX5]|nr:ABC transporter ATP-binding protein [Caldilinea sp. CFX5]
MKATRKLSTFLAPYWHWAILAPLLMVLEVSMDLLQPHLIQQIIDDGVLQRNMNVVLTNGAWMIGVATIAVIGGVGCTIFAVLAAQGLGADLRHTLFAKVQSFSFGNLDKMETGALITRLTNDVNQVQEVVMMVLRVMVRAPLLMVGSLLMAIITSPQLALLFVVLIPIVLVALVWIINRAYPLFGGVQQRLDALNTVMQENLAGVRVVKAFVRTQHEIERFRRANNNLMEQNLQAVRTVAVTMPFNMLILNAGIVAALWIGGVQVNTGGMQVGQVVAFINYLMQALMSLVMVSMLTMRFARAEASSVRILEVLESGPTIQNKPDAITTFDPQGRVVFDNVNFSYDGVDHDPVLKDINIVAEPGQTIALLGATGSGKSSLVQLIPRFYDVTSGAVTIDGVDVRAIDEQALRRKISVALQESILFSGTIRDNIRYGKPDASAEEVVAAAQLAQAHHFIIGFPDGYDTIVGQRGVNLSGGQKQRIAIARALLTDPAILILDDSTSAVDVETEARLQDALVELRRDRTAFIVAQRISTVLTADKILVLDDGRIVAEGTHDELLATSPIYREIYALQMESDSPGAPVLLEQPATNGKGNKHE